MHRVKTDSEMEMVLEKMEKIKKQGEREGRFLKVDTMKMHIDDENDEDGEDDEGKEENEDNEYDEAWEDEEDQEVEGRLLPLGWAGCIFTEY